MSSHTIQQPDRPGTLSPVVALSATGALWLVMRLGWAEADVFRDGIYHFSLRIEDSGLCCILQREAREQKVSRMSPGSNFR